jgi:hypothetical protein
MLTPPYVEDAAEQGRVTALLNSAMVKKDVALLIDLVEEYRDRPWFPALFDEEAERTDHPVTYQDVLQMLDETEDEEWSGETPPSTMSPSSETISTVTEPQDSATPFETPRGSTDSGSYFARVFGRFWKGQ